MVETITVSVNATSYNEDWTKIVINEIINQIYTFEMKMSVENTGTNYTNIANGKEVVINYDGTELMRGTITDIDYTSDEEITIKGIRSGAYILMRKQSDNYVKTTYPTSSIVTDLCSGVITVGTNTNYGNVDFRAQDSNNMLSLIRMARVINYDWWFDYSGGNERFNINTRKGSATPVKIFKTYGTDFNCTVATRKKDQTGVWNRVKVKGFGDYNQQIESAWADDLTSQGLWGIRERGWVDKTKSTIAECDLLRDQILSDRKDPINKFTLEIDDPTEVLPAQVVVGDEVTIDDNNIFLTGEVDFDYKIIERRIEINPGGEYNVSLTCASRTYSFIEEIAHLAGQQQAYDNFQQINQLTEDTAESANSTNVVDVLNTVSAVTGINYSSTVTGGGTLGVINSLVASSAGGTIDLSQTTQTQDHSSNSKATANSTIASSSTGGVENSYGATGSWNTVYSMGNPGNNTLSFVMSDWRWSNYSSNDFGFVRVEAGGSYFPDSSGIAIQMRSFDTTHQHTLSAHTHPLTGGPTPDNTNNVLANQYINPYTSCMIPVPLTTGANMNLQFRTSGTSHTVLYQAHWIAIGISVPATGAGGLVAGAGVLLEKTSPVTTTTPNVVTSGNSSNVVNSLSTSNRASSNSSESVVNSGTTTPAVNSLNLDPRVKTVSD